MTSIVDRSFEPVPEITDPLPTRERDALYGRFARRIVVNSDLDRALVSFQGNRNELLARPALEARR